MLTGKQSKLLVFLKNRCRDLETKRYSHKEICTLLQEIAQIINNHPLAGEQVPTCTPLVRLT